MKLAWWHRKRRTTKNVLKSGTNTKFQVLPPCEIRPSRERSPHCQRTLGENKGRRSDCTRGLLHLKYVSANLPGDIVLMQKPWVTRGRIIKWLQNIYLIHSIVHWLRLAQTMFSRQKEHARSSVSGPEFQWPNRGHDSPSTEEHLTYIIAVENINLLRSCDTNGIHTLWSSSRINERDESLFDFVIKTNPSIYNRWNTPTFHFTSPRNRDRWEKVINITLLTDNESFRVESLIREPSLITVGYFLVELLF